MSLTEKKRKNYLRMIKKRKLIGQYVSSSHMLFRTLQYTKRDIQMHTHI